MGQPEAEVVDVAGELGRFEDVEVEIAVDEPSGGPVEVVGAHGEQATVLVLGADGADGGVDQLLDQVCGGMDPHAYLVSPGTVGECFGDKRGCVLGWGRRGEVDAERPRVADSVDGIGQPPVSAALTTCGATLADVISWSIYVIDGADLHAAFGAVASRLDPDADPALVTVAMVAGLAVPGALVEMSAIAAVLP